MTVRWYPVYPLSYGHAEERLLERGMMVHATINRYNIKYVPALARRLHNHKQQVGQNWKMDVTYSGSKENGFTIIEQSMTLKTLSIFIYI